MMGVLITNKYMKVIFRDRMSEDTGTFGRKELIEEFKVYQSQWEHPVLVSKTPACTFPYLAPFYKLIGRETWDSHEQGLSVHQF
jgi:hypothetical protein